LVHQRRAVLLKQTKDWFHMRSDDQPNNLCGPLRIMGGRHKITGALTNQISLIQTDHRVRIVILSPTPIKHLPLLRISSWSMDHLVFHPPTSREDA
jgi:hypothetical protein